MLSNVLFISIGAGVGVLARVIASDWIKHNNRRVFPFSTFTVNMCGSLLLGMVTGFGPGASISLLISTGFLGSFTTFSTFNVENIELLRRRKHWQLFFYLGGSYVFGIALLFMGIALGNRL